MAFISDLHEGATYAPGYFLAAGECERQTRQIPQEGATTVDSGKYVKAGTPFPSNDGNAVGLLYEDVDVTVGDMPGSVVTKGTVYADRLPVTLAQAAQTALEGKGFTFIASAPTVTRPY